MDCVMVTGLIVIIYLYSTITAVLAFNEHHVMGAHAPRGPHSSTNQPTICATTIGVLPPGRYADQPARPCSTDPALLDWTDPVDPRHEATLESGSHLCVSLESVWARDGAHNGITTRRGSARQGDSVARAE